MAMRYKTKRVKDRKIFGRTAMQMQSANLGTSPFRGGYRF